MATMLETPSRIWRRIEEVEDRDMPSLPSLPPFEDSAELGHFQTSNEDHSSDAESDGFDYRSASNPIHSTPAASSHHTAVSTIRAASSTSSTARFASSIASRSTKSSSGFSGSRGMSTRRSQHDSFDISVIPSLPGIQPEPGTGHYSEDSHESPDGYLSLGVERDHGTGEEDISLTEALQSVSRTNSPPYPVKDFEKSTPRKYYDYEVSLRSEPKPSPFDKFRNINLRRTLARTRTPSLSRTTPSPTSSPANSTPHSTRSFALPRSNAGSPIPGASIPLPRSTTASPAIIVHRPEDEPVASEESFANQETGIRSMDITDIHISPAHPQFESESEHGDQDPMEDLQTEDEQDPSSRDEKEQTFSSDGIPTSYAKSNTTGLNGNSPIALSTAFSSPVPSISFTPTPAFPRPRARFNLPPPPSDLLATPSGDGQTAEDEGRQHEDPLTPHTRRRSFLLSVVNSTTRPRMKFPTPHPRMNPITPSMDDSTTTVPDSVKEPLPISDVNLQTAFTGVTPRPRPRARASHPLSKAIPALPVTSESESNSPSGSGPASAASNSQWPTSAQASPYDGAMDRASFISTASSHDLTTHHRANTSFDPAMGFGVTGQGQGVGRFNAGKLNNYLHGLNRRLQEENEILVERLRRMEEEKVVGEATSPVVSESRSAAERRLSGGGRRVSLGGNTLGDLVEDVGGEGWVEEKAELEELVAEYREEAAKCAAEKEDIEKALEHEQAERARDKERWKERMGEVERGVSEIVKDLEGKLQEAEEQAELAREEKAEELREMEKQLDGVEAELRATMERAKKAEQVLESGKELGGELREANDRAEKVMGNLRNANAQIKELEEQVMRSDRKMDELEKELKEEREFSGGLEDELTATADQLATERGRVQRMEGTIKAAEDELQSTKAYIAELEEGAQAAVERIDSLEDELASTDEKFAKLNIVETESRKHMNHLEDEVQKAQELARQMEEALEAAENKMVADEEAIAELKSKVASLEREKQREASVSIHEPTHTPGPTDADLEALEKELDHAHKEIARLTTILSQSPARKAMDKAKDMRIQTLEKEKEELVERNKALRMTVTEINTPNKLINASGISPIHRQVLSMSIRAPRTPGAPLRDISWLNNTAADPSTSPLVAEISRLQRELDRANESIDDKLDKLEDAGLGVVGLTKKLEDARSKIRSLEDQISRLTRVEERRLRRLERARCQKCLAKVDLRGLIHIEGDESSMSMMESSLPTEPPTPPTKTSDALRAGLRAVNADLDTLKMRWDDEKRQLLGEKAALQDATDRLNAEVREAREEAKRVANNERAGEKTRAGVQGELEKAKRTIADLESDLKAERSRLRALTTEHDRIQRDKNSVLTQLQRTESDMNDIRKQLQNIKQENHHLETELRVNSNAEQKARLLEDKVSENLETIEQLRQERSLLVVDHKDLQRKFAEISEQASRLRDEYTASAASHDNRRQQLDLHLTEIDELRRAVSNQADELHQAETEKQRISAEKREVAQTVAILEADLRRVKQDAEAFGRDLKLLRIEKEKTGTKHQEEILKLERSKKQYQTQLRLLTEQLDNQRELTQHVCLMDERQLSALKLQHNKECKGLIAKFTRESSLRSDLSYQKHYLLVLLSRYEKSEQTIFASIAQIGFSVDPPPAAKKVRRLKSLALAAVFLSRVKRASDIWREQSSSKQAVAAALQDVRRRRATVSIP
ncbi:hypothetical protein BD779DRAFT_1661469 [Infundibulicybe gibba]|nr:hypothetical protein BD779DRAFT_1661469 [Infundibulicybe gibba]